jgi:hypothetical protein
MNRNSLALAATLCSVLALGACSSARFGSFGPGPGPAAAAPAPMPEAVEAVPSGPVMSEPLPPIAGQGPIASGPVVAAPGNDIVAGLPSQPVAPPVVAAPSGRSALVGNWTARDAAGTSCRVQLSSSPALDLYRASAAGCGNKDLSKVTAWDYRDGEIYLYQPGGTVTARLRGSGAALSGVLAKSGAPLTLSK